MYYALLVYENHLRWNALPDSEKRRISDACSAWHYDLEKRGVARAATGLHPVETAATIRRQHGVLNVTDGPYAETKEVLGGFETVECQSLDEAVAIAKTFPALCAGFAMEVREVLLPADLESAAGGA